MGLSVTSTVRAVRARAPSVVVGAFCLFFLPLLAGCGRVTRQVGMRERLPAQASQAWA